MRTYLTGATFKHERTKHLAWNATCAAIGSILGPLIQAALTNLECTEKLYEDSYIAFDMYTSCG